MQKKKTIDLGLRLNILYHLFQGESPTNVIDHLPDDQLDSLYQFMWEKTIDIGIRAYGPDFSHEKLLVNYNTSLWMKVISPTATVEQYAILPPTK